MFKLDLSKTYFFPVTVETPEDGGKFKKSTFDAEFNRLSKSEIKAIFDRMPKSGAPSDDAITDEELLDKVLVGWKGITDQNGDVLPYSETAREAMLEVQGVSNGIITAYFASIAGSKQKN